MRGSSILAATAIMGASGVTAACGQPQAAVRPADRTTTAKCAAGASSSRSGATLSIDNADNGTVVCIDVGAHLFVFLGGTQARMWTPIRSDSGALTPEPNGALALAVGVTGAFFAAAHHGIARVTSMRSACHRGASAGCGTSSVFHVTVVVSR
jgi:hypothetical protein